MVGRETYPSFRSSREKLSINSPTRSRLWSAISTPRANRRFAHPVVTTNRRSDKASASPSAVASSDIMGPRSTFTGARATRKVKTTSRSWILRN